MSNVSQISQENRKICVIFFDCDVLAYLIDKYGSDLIKKRLKEYEGLFKEFSKRRVIECPSNAFGEREESERVVTLISRFLDFG